LTIRSIAPIIIFTRDNKQCKYRTIGISLANGGNLLAWKITYGANPPGNLPRGVILGGLASVVDLMTEPVRRII
jgi:hypothetical protein